MAYPFVPVATTSFVGNSWGGSYDAVLARTEMGPLSYKLTVKLRVMLAQHEPSPPFVLDGEGLSFMTRPWSNADWAKFVTSAKAQANMWNNQFWLKPPPDVDAYDHHGLDGSITRPYIKCELDVDFSPPYPLAHAVIKAVNLDTNVLSSEARARMPNDSPFRSNALIFSSFDDTPSLYSVPNQAGKVDKLRQFTIAHELGHVLGLGHIGVIKKTLLCQTAINLNAIGQDVGLFKGGSDSMLCYGWNQPSNIRDNIMGYGMSFSAENAMPWVSSILRMRSKPTEYWEVLLKEPGSPWFFPPRKKA